MNKEIVIYQASSGAIELRGDAACETIWATLDQITAVFGRHKSVISRHIRNIFKEGELDQNSVVAIFATTAADSYGAYALDCRKRSEKERPNDRARNAIA